MPNHYDDKDDVNKLQDELNNLQKMVDDMTKYAGDLVDEFDVDLSDVSGSINDMTNVVTQINSESPFLDDIFKGDSWKKVLKATVPGVNLDDNEASPGGEPDSEPPQNQQQETTEEPQPASEDNPVWFQEFDLNNDGKLDALDATAWVTKGRADISQKIIDFVLGNEPMPPKKPNVD